LVVHVSNTPSRTGETGIGRYVVSGDDAMPSAGCEDAGAVEAESPLKLLLCQKRSLSSVLSVD
jgi:hypothetical protein